MSETCQVCFKQAELVAFLEKCDMDLISPLLWHTKLQLFLWWLQLRHLTLCGTFVAWLGPLPHA